MSSKVKSLCFLWILPFLLCACFSSRQDVTGGVALEAAVASGVIAEIDSLDIKESDYRLSEVRVGRMQRVQDVNVSLYSPFRRDLYFKNDGGRISGIPVSSGERVKKGDVLAEIVFEQESLTAQREQLLIQISQFEQQYTNEDARYQSSLNQWMHAPLTERDETEAELHTLRQAKAELEYEKFKYDQERVRAGYAKQLKELDEKLAGEQILAPFDGVVRYVYSAKPGTVVRSWTHILTVEDDSALMFITQGSIDVLRYGDIFPVENDKFDLSFEVRVVSDPIVTDTREGQYYYVLVPLDTEGLLKAAEERGLTLDSAANIALTGHPNAHDVDNVLIAPRDAVRQEDTKQFVYLYEDGIIKKRYVNTGLNFMNEIQIIEGLEAGQMVVLN